jgi:hypothetical protein
VGQQKGKQRDSSWEWLLCLLPWSMGERIALTPGPENLGGGHSKPNLGLGARCSLCLQQAPGPSGKSSLTSRARWAPPVVLPSLPHVCFCQCLPGAVSWLLTSYPFPNIVRAGKMTIHCRTRTWHGPSYIVVHLCVIEPPYPVLSLCHHTLC